MSDLKINIDQLKNYLGTGLKIGFEEDEHQYEFVGLDLNYEGVQLISQSGWFYRCELHAVKPICYRLSDLDKFIPELGFVPIEEILKIATKQIWGEPIDPFGECEILTEGESTGIIAWNDTERVSFTVDKNERRFDFTLYMDGSEMMLNKWDLFQKLFQWHFWPFGDEYFEKGLVIDKLKKDE